MVVDHFGNARALGDNVKREYEQNGERYNFLKWGQDAFTNFRVVPPGTGICHQVNLEYLAQTVWTAKDGGSVVAYPDTLVGTDSHTTMANGLAVLGWGVGGMRAEACMLGQPATHAPPAGGRFQADRQAARRRHGHRLSFGGHADAPQERRCRQDFVEFYGDGLKALSLADRATIANMAPEYGATIGVFPIDQETLNYLTMSGRAADRIALVEAYAKAQGLFRTSDLPDPVFSDTLELESRRYRALAGRPEAS